MITGIEVPLELAVLVCAGFLAAGAWAGQHRVLRQLGLRGGVPRRGSPWRVKLAPTIDLTSHRDARREVSQALLHGRIDQITALRAASSSATENEVRDQIVAVMRAGLRRGDSMAVTDSGRFTITVAGADEPAALRIADRLRRKIAQLRVPQVGLETRLTASFGVAAQRNGQDAEALARRARRALDAAVARGQDHVVPASEIEEIRLLPAPAPTTSGSAAAA